MMFSNILLASDHRGVSLKSHLFQALRSHPIPVRDLGPLGDAPVAYPIYAQKMADAFLKDYGGILICGTGLGMGMASNRYPHIRGALCHTKGQAQKSREHNNANVLILGADTIDPEHAIDMVKLWMNTPFKGGRHQERVQMFNTFAKPFWLSSRYDRRI